tara:strand:- start:93 stop:806 length:714 start_codon:yes stop_codon:yes gene_type:complete
MENSQLWAKFFFSRISSRCWPLKRDHNKSDYNNNNYHRNHLCLWAIILFFIPVKVSANTTVASPSSNAQGVVNNNATMITPSSLPQNRYSQGIVCTSPSLTITPYLTDAWSFNRPIETVTRQNIYDEDTGEIKYIQETPRFEKDNYNLNYGISMQFNIPLGKGGELCQKAAKVNIEAQELLIAKTKMEMELYRLKICGEQARLGVVFIGKYQVNCDGIKLITQPNQVLPHTHKLKTK